LASDKGSPVSADAVWRPLRFWLASEGGEEAGAGAAAGKGERANDRGRRGGGF